MKIGYCFDTERIKKLLHGRMKKDGHMWVNVKVDPEWRDLWRNTYEAVIPGYHQNKEHWNSVRLDGSIPDEEIKRMIAESYDLVVGEAKRIMWSIIFG